MLNRIRDRFGTAGLIVSLMALVLALAGGAFAASGGLNAKQKKQVKAIAKTFAGKEGATGPAGPAGPAGANGNDGARGANGTNGTNGTNGQSVTVADEAAFGNCGDASGYKLDSVSGTDYVCNGLDGAEGDKGDTGDPWTAGGTLPPRATLTGAWSAVDTVGAGITYGDVSFPVRLAAPLGSGNVHTFMDANFADFDEGGAGTEGCTGSGPSPTAPPGHLCVYGESATGGTRGLVAVTVRSPLAPGIGASFAGAIVEVTASSPTYVIGSFAVTG